MTEKQRTRLYFPAWGRACHANDWHMVKGRLVGVRVERHSPSADINQLYQRVWTEGIRRAVQAHRSVTADDLRHACHIVALGRDKSSDHLTNAEVDKVVAIFRLLADPDDLDAILALDHPDTSERKRRVVQINKLGFPDAFIVDICRRRTEWSDLYESPFWEDLPLSELRQLQNTLLAIRADHRREKGNRESGIGNGDDDPQDPIPHSVLPIPSAVPAP